MTQVDSQKSNASTQVQTSALMSELSQGSNYDGQEIGRGLQNGNGSDNGKKDAVKVDGKMNCKGGRKKPEPKKDQRKGERRRKAKDETVQDNTKEKDDDKFCKKIIEEKQKSLRKKKALCDHNVPCDENTSTPAGKQAAKPQRDSSTLREEQREFLEPSNVKGILIAPSASVEDDVPFQYCKTPRRLQKSPETDKNLEKGEDKPGKEVQAGEINSMKERREIVREMLEHAVVEGTANRGELESGDEARRNLNNHELEDHLKKFGKTPSQKQIPKSTNSGIGEEKCLSTDEDNDLFLDLSEEQKQWTEENEKVEKSSKDGRNEEFSGVREQDKKKPKSIKEKGSQRQATSAEDKSSPAEDKEIEQRSAHENRDHGSRRVLRRRAKEIKQKTNIIDGETVTKKSKTSVECRKGREPAILKKSSPEVEPFSRDIEMSSREIDRTRVDKLRPSRGTTAHKPLDGTSQPPETEVLGGLSKGASAHGQLFKGLKSDEGELVLSDNSIKTVEETFSVHEKPSHSEKYQRGLEVNNEKEKDGLSSKNRNWKPTEQQLQAVDDVTESKRQRDVDTTDVDSNTQLTSQTHEQKSQDTGRSRRNKQGHTETRGEEKITKGSKENALGDKKTGKKKR